MHSLFGPNTESEWVREGRRIIPLLKRGRPITGFTPTADAHKQEIEKRNRLMLPPLKTKAPKRKVLSQAKGLMPPPPPIKDLISKYNHAESEGFSLLCPGIFLFPR